MKRKIRIRKALILISTIICSLALIVPGILRILGVI
jgi:hypothetical protein